MKDSKRKQTLALLKEALDLLCNGVLQWVAAPNEVARACETMKRARVRRAEEEGRTAQKQRLQEVVAASFDYRDLDEYRFRLRQPLEALSEKAQARLQEAGQNESSETHKRRLLAEPFGELWQCGIHMLHVTLTQANALSELSQARRCYTQGLETEGPVGGNGYLIQPHRKLALTDRYWRIMAEARTLSPASDFEKRTLSERLDLIRDKLLGLEEHITTRIPFESWGFKEDVTGRVPPEVWELVDLPEETLRAKWLKRDGRDETAQIALALRLKFRPIIHKIGEILFKACALVEGGALAN